MSYKECKNKNEYLLDGNRFIRTIQRCRCTEKVGNQYVLDCKIVERGNQSYTYLPGDAFLSRYDQKLWLDEKAKEEICSADPIGIYDSSPSVFCND